jgi:hypothetical protein
MRTLRLLAFIGVLAILGATAIGLYFFGGFYSVAGTAADSDLVTLGVDSHSYGFNCAPRQ